MRCTPSRIVLGLGMSSRPQQESDLWTGQYSLRRSPMAFPPMGLSEIGRGCVAIGTEGSSDGLLQCLSEGDHDEPDWSNPATAERKTVRARRNGAAERGGGGEGGGSAGGRGCSGCCCSKFAAGLTSFHRGSSYGWPTSVSGKQVRGHNLSELRITVLTSCNSCLICQIYGLDNGCCISGSR